MIEAELAFVTARGADAPHLLLKAAQRLESIDAGLARSTYLQAVSAAIFSDAVTRGDVGQLVHAAAAAPPPAGTPTATDLLLDGIAAHYTQGYAALSTCGTTTAGSGFRIATSSLPEASARSASFRRP